MDTTIGLCHFCEAHGPRPVFCTFATDNEEEATESSSPTAQCNGCRSLGSDTVVITKEHDELVYCSRESIPDNDMNAFLRQAAIRCITCEVNWSKEGGIVYFSDTKGHVLSCTFQLKDTRARGLKRWFSIVVLMKEKDALLNATPLLSDHMQKIAEELQELSEKVFDDEQKVCSQRALRLNTGSNYFGQSRSLVQLTGNEDIFTTLHTYFTRMLQAINESHVEKSYTSLDLFKNLNLNEKDRSIFSGKAFEVASSEEYMTLRALENLVGRSVFRILLYAVLTGINIVIKSPQNDRNSRDIVHALSRLLPLTQPDCVPHVHITDDPDIVETSDTCILERNEYSYRWLGELPAKCPMLMSRIEDAMNCEDFLDDVLHKHVNYLLLDWLRISRALHSAIAASGPTSDAVKKLKPVLGIGPHDEKLVHYWINMFCS